MLFVDVETDYTKTTRKKKDHFFFHKKYNSRKREEPINMAIKALSLIPEKTYRENLSIRSPIERVCASEVALS